MTIVTAAFATYEAIGNREDLTNVIYNISPTETPFLTTIGKSKAKATKHEWQTDTLATAVTTNAQLEGNDYNGTATSRTPKCALATPCRSAAAVPLSCWRP